MPIALVLAILALVFLLLALIPARRLWHMGVPLWPRIVYLATLVGLGIVAFEIRPLARFLLPLIIFLFLLPFSNLGKYWDRWRRLSSRDGGGPAGGDGGRSSPGSSRRTKDSDSVIDGQAVRLETDEPPPK
jgi:hypothetical protein